MLALYAGLSDKHLADFKLAFEADLAHSLERQDKQSIRFCNGRLNIIQAEQAKRRKAGQGASR